MRLYIRNRCRYNPASPKKPPICLEVHDFAQTLIWQLKEDIRKVAPSVKCEELFYFNAQGCHRLEDGRSVAHYRLHDGAILETTSNPFLASCMYILLQRSRLKQAQCSPKDRLYTSMRRSIIHKSSILNVLFNSSKEFSDKQPKYFDDIQEFIDFIRAHRKKGVEMSRFTIDNLFEMYDEFMDKDQHEEDPVGSFVSRSAEELGHRNNGNADGTSDIQNDDPDGNLQKSGKRKAVANKKKRATPVKKATPRKQNPVEDRACDHCGDSVAFIYCPDCAEGSVYCEGCSDVLHRAPGKRNHTIQDIATAPKPKKGYVPQPYRAPFAIILALYRGVVAPPAARLLSMTEEELKERAQTVTDTDLSQKSPGKWFAGFDCVNNLITKGLLKREATERPTYALTQTGIQLGEKLDGFHNRFYRIQTQGDLPELPNISAEGMNETLVIRGRRVCLVIDRKEKQFERFESLCRERGVPVVRRDLPSGDYLWLLLPAGAGSRYDLDQWDLEQVLPFIVERKTWDDLQETIRSDRFEKQISKMLKTGLKNVFYVVEGHIGDMRSRPNEEEKTFYRNQLEDIEQTGFVKVNYTGSWMKTVNWLHWLTLLAARSHNAAVSTGGSVELCTYREYMVRANGKRTHHVRAVRRLKHVHVVSGEQFIENIFRDHQNIQKIQASTRQLIAETTHKVQPEYGEHLLIIQGLEAYNKHRQSKLNAAMNAVVGQSNRPHADVVDECFRTDMGKLVHYDIASYNQLLLQIALGLHVMRTEKDDDTEVVRNRIEPGGVPTNRRTPEQFVGEARYEEPPLPRLPYMPNLLGEDEMIREVLQRSKVAAVPDTTSLDEQHLLDAVLDRSLRETRLDSDLGKPNDLFVPNENDEDKQLKKILELSRIEYEKSHNSNLQVDLTVLNDIEKPVARPGAEEIIDLVTPVTVQPTILSQGGTMDDPISVDDSRDKEVKTGEGDQVFDVQTSRRVVDFSAVQWEDKHNENMEVPEAWDQQDEIQSEDTDSLKGLEDNSLEAAFDTKDTHSKSTDDGVILEDMAPEKSLRVDTSTPAFIKQQEIIFDNIKKESIKAEMSFSEASSKDQETVRDFDTVPDVKGLRTPKQSRKRHGSPTYSVEKKKRQEMGRFKDIVDDEACARKLMDTSDKMVQNSSMLVQDEVFARKLSYQDEDLTRQLSSQSNQDEELARKLSIQDEVNVGTGDKMSQNSSMLSQDEFFARKLYSQDEDLARKLSTQDEDLARKLSSQDEDLARKLSSQDEDLARKLSSNDEVFARKLSNQDEDLARYLSNQDEQLAKKLSSQSNQDKELARKLSEEKSYETSTADDEALARALHEELVNGKNTPPSVDRDADLARQLSEQLNSRESPTKSDEMGSPLVMGRQMARVEPFAHRTPSAAGGSSAATAFVTPRGKQSARKPTATYTPLSASQGDSFVNQLAAIRAQNHQHYMGKEWSSAKKGGVGSKPPKTYTAAHRETTSSPLNKLGGVGNRVKTAGTVDWDNDKEMTKINEKSSVSVGLTCGACGEKGHTRSMKCCPRFNDHAEVERRNVSKAKRQETQMRKAEEKKQERENTIKQFEQTQETLRQAEDALKEQGRQLTQELRRLRRQDKVAENAQKRRNNRN